MERFGDCDLFDFISESTPLNESIAKNIFHQVVETVYRCQVGGVFHGDIYDENILLDKNTMKVKLIDFGSGNWFKPSRLYCKYKGVSVHAPPEWISTQRFYAESLTVWSLGILLYDLLFGYVPFEKDEEIIQGANGLFWYSILNISSLAKSLVEGCLHPDQAQRFTLKQVQEHPWFGCEGNKSCSEG